MTRTVGVQKILISLRVGTFTCSEETLDEVEVFLSLFPWNRIDFLFGQSKADVRYNQKGISSPLPLCTSWLLLLLLKIPKFET